MTMYIMTCPNCGKECGYYLGAEDLKTFCSKDCLTAFSFPLQMHSDLKESDDITYECNNSNSPTTKSEASVDDQINTEQNNAPVTSTVCAKAFAKSYNKIVLTPRELEIIELVAAGKTNKEIASVLYISQRTIETYVSILLRTYEFENRTQLSTFYSINKHNICTKAQLSESKDSYRIRKIKSNPLYQKIATLYSQGTVSYQVVAHMVGCSQGYAKASIRRLNKEKAENYFVQNIKSGMNEKLLKSNI